MTDKIRTLISLHISEDERSYVTVYHVRVASPRETDTLTQWYDVDTVRYGSLTRFTWREHEMDAYGASAKEVYDMSAFHGIALRYAHRTGTKFYDFLNFVPAPIGAGASIG